MGLWKLYRKKKAAKNATEKFMFRIENLRRKANSQPPILTRCDKIKRFLSRFYPPFDEDLKPDSSYKRMFIKGTKEHAIARLARNIVMLEFFGIVTYSVLSLKYAKNPAVVGTFVSIVIHFFLALMLVFPNMMYYFMLSAHRMLSSKIRTLLLVVILSIAFEVPAMNALHNISKVAEGVSCIQNDVTSSAKAVDENLAKHGEVAMKMVRDLIIKLSGPVNKFKKIIQKFDRKVSGVIDMIKKTWSNLANLTNKCKNMMTGPYRKCLNSFHEAYIYCASREMKLTGKSCTALQKADKICDLGKEMGDSVCSFPHQVKNGLQEGAMPYYKEFWKKVFAGVKGAHYYHIKAFKYGLERGKNVKQELKNLGSIDLVINSKKKRDSTMRQLKENLKKTLTSIIETYKATIHLITSIIHWTLLPLALFWPFFSTALFIYKFNYREDYKNNYLTSEFEKIDLDCALKGRNKLLPLSQKEKITICKRTSWAMTTGERREYKLNLAMTTLAMVTPMIFMLLDVSIYVILITVFDVFSRIKIEFPAHYELKVSGDGYGAKLLTILLQTFSPVTEGLKNRDEVWRRCFPEPSAPSAPVYSLMMFLFVVCLVLCRTKVWLSRQSLALADYFFPHRVRTRALYLYNKILSERKNMMTSMMHEQRAILADDQIEGRGEIVRKGMQSRGYIRVNCCKCHKAELRLADVANTRLCVTCGAFYCIECFCFTKFCIECETDMQLIDGIDLYYEELSEDERDEEDEEEDDDPNPSNPDSHTKTLSQQKGKISKSTSTFSQERTRTKEKLPSVEVVKK